MTVPIRLKRGTWTTAKLIPHLFSPRSTAIAECIRVYIVPQVWFICLWSLANQPISIRFSSTLQPSEPLAVCGGSRFGCFHIQIVDIWQIEEVFSLLARSVEFKASELDCLFYLFSSSHLAGATSSFSFAFWGSRYSCLEQHDGRAKWIVCWRRGVAHPFSSSLWTFSEGNTVRGDVGKLSSPPVRLTGHVIPIRPSTEHQHRIKIMLRRAERREEWGSKSEIKIKLIVEQPQIVYNKHPLAEF